MTTVIMLGTEALPLWSKHLWSILQCPENERITILLKLPHFLRHNFNLLNCFQTFYSFLTYKSKSPVSNYRGPQIGIIFNTDDYKVMWNLHTELFVVYWEIHGKTDPGQLSHILYNSHLY
jgi:hypothetical protein